MERKVAAMNTDFSDRPVRREEYLRLLDGLVYGDDPRQGYFVDGVFHHPDMAFALSFPVGWKTANTRQAVAGISAESDAIVRLTMGAEPSAADAVEAFLENNDVIHGGVRSRSLNGLRAVGVDFTLATDRGTLQGRVVCVEYHEQVFKLVGYAPQDRWSVHGPEIERSLESFRTLTNRPFLDVQPMRIDIVTPDRTMDADELARRYDASVDAETLGLLNGMDAGESFESGRTYKVVRGGKLPDSAAR
jgi:predicted Zn-dependent protease